MSIESETPPPDKKPATPEPVKTYVATLPTLVFDIRARNPRQVRAHMARIVREQVTVALATYDDGRAAALERRPIYDATREPEDLQYTDAEREAIVAQHIASGGKAFGFNIIGLGKDAPPDTAFVEAGSQGAPDDVVRIDLKPKLDGDAPIDDAAERALPADPYIPD